MALSKFEGIVHDFSQRVILLLGSPILIQRHGEIGFGFSRRLNEHQQGQFILRFPWQLQRTTIKRL